MKRLLLHLCLLFCLCGCGFVYEHNLTGNYYLIAIDGMEDMRVSYYERDVYLGIGGNGVYEVGFDEHFILTKTHKEQTDIYSAERYDKTVTEYYIIPVDNTQRAYEAQENCFGPLTKQEFETKRKELGVSDQITFKGI